MPLVVEDGTARTDADSYASLDYAANYHAARGNSAWAALAVDEVREQLLRKATDYMLQAYRELWAGTRVSSTQALDWPRYDVLIKDAPSGYAGFAAVYPEDEVPKLVANACAELALRAATKTLAPDLSPAAIRKKVGPLEVEYAPGYRQQVRFQAIDNMLAPLLRGGGGSIPVLRA